MAGAPQEPSATLTRVSATQRVRSRSGCAFLLFLLVLGVYGLTAGGHTTSNDEEAMLATSEALIDHGTPELDINEQNTIRVAARVEGRTGEPVSFASFSQSLVGLPLLVAGKVLAEPLDERHEPFAERLVLLFTNAVITAAGVALFFLIALELGARRRWALLLALVYAFATFAWPHSKTFFSEPLTTSLMLASVLVVLRTGPGALRRPLVAGLLLGLAVFSRPLALVYGIPIGVYLLYRTYRGAASLRGAVGPVLAFLAGGVPPCVLLLATNWWRFGDPMEFGYPGEGVRFDFPLLDGLYGLLLSPGKGLAWFAPPAIVGVAGLMVAVRRRRYDVLMVGAVGVVNVLVFAKYWQWHGDHAWGPRYLIMSLPFLILPVSPLLDRVAWRKALGATAAAGFIVAVLGVGVSFNSYFTWAGARLQPVMLPDGPSSWKSTHWEPRWSQITGHAILLPYATLNTARRIPGGGKEMPPFPEGTDPRYDWYLRVPAQLDFWQYWLIPTGSPKVLIFLAVPFVAATVVGGRAVLDELGAKKPWRRRVRSPASAQRAEVAA